ncbi:MAG: TetR family transcriptional regulator C-terminal domain-containing protein [Parvularculaceae bacterium]
MPAKTKITRTQIISKSETVEPHERKKTRITIKNEKKILDAAQTVIAEYGFHGATIDRVAEQAGMSKPNLHYYFKTKTDLYKAVLQRTLDIWLDSLAKLDPDGDPETELSTYIVEKVEMSRLHPTASRVFANEMLRGGPLLKDYLKNDLKKLVNRKARVIEHWIREGKIAPINPVHLIFLIWAATQHYADFQPQVRAVLGVGDLNAQQFKKIEQSLCEIIIRGVLPR